MLSGVSRRRMWACPRRPSAARSSSVTGRSSSRQRAGRREVTEQVLNQKTGPALTPEQVTRTTDLHELVADEPH